MARKQASKEMKRIGSSKPVRIRVPKLDVDALLSGWSCDPTLRARVSILASSFFPLDRVSAVGLLVRCWEPVSREERTRLLNDLLSWRQYSEVEERARAWAQKMSSSTASTIDRSAASMADLMVDKMDYVRDFLTDRNVRSARICLRGILDRRTELKGVLQLLGDKGVALRLSLEMLDRTLTVRSVEVAECLNS